MGDYSSLQLQRRCTAVGTDHFALSLFQVRHCPFLHSLHSFHTVSAAHLLHVSCLARVSGRDKMNRAAFMSGPAALSPKFFQRRVVCTASLCRVPVAGLSGPRSGAVAVGAVKDIVSANMTQRLMPERCRGWP